MMANAQCFGTVFLALLNTTFVQHLNLLFRQFIFLMIRVERNNDSFSVFPRATTPLLKEGASNVWLHLTIVMGMYCVTFNYAIRMELTMGGKLSEISNLSAP